MTAGCELLSRATTKTYFQVANQGSDFLSLQNSSPEGDSRAQSVCDLTNQCEGIKGTVHRLIRNTCPRFALMLGKWISRGKVSSAPSSTLFLYSLPFLTIPFKVRTQKSSGGRMVAGQKPLEENTACILMWVTYP